MSQPLRIGFSACMFQPDPKRNVFKGRRLLYLEEGMAHYVMKGGALPQLMPTAGGQFSVSDLVDTIDGLLLTGGDDVAPESYGEEGIEDRRWPGDRFRDAYEIDLINECLEKDVPVLGICRGAQILNVALGGTMYQDITTQVPEALIHRSHELYHENVHEVDIVPDTGLAALYPGVSRALINSVHHQGLKDIAKDLAVEAISPADEVVEAVRYSGNGRYLFGVQWHPEFVTEEQRARLLPTEPILDEFLAAIRARKD